MRNLPLLFIFLLCTCVPATCYAQSVIPTSDSGSQDHAQSPDTIITVTTAAGSRAANLPYPEARAADPRTRERLALSQNERSEHPRLSRLPSPSERGRGRGFEDCIHNRHARLLQVNLATLQESKKGAWLKYLPSVSAGLSPALRRDQEGNFSSRLTPTLSIGLNSSLIYQAHRAGQQHAATREAIIKRSQFQEDLEIAKLHRLQRRLQIETDKLNLHVGVTDIDRQLFNLYQKQYDNHDISPEEYLLKRKAFLLQELRNQDQITRIQAIKYEIEDLAGCLTSPQIQAISPTRK
ncbi:hypothetical protein [Neolewinella agarilytica]|uniref:Outer membrane efflux protein n=1 Tax=Neolewinella agarilytica TaxID=478744 RepID=A0A1H9H7K8_9BACT|nr:hypothetical protein [Neolewinella agarilytica]SEQ58208.1 hypothetical protein SAMN05444359_11245 [Neolewinella agarilytica]